MSRPIPLTDLDRRLLASGGPSPANHTLVVDFEPSRSPPFSLGELRWGAVAACRAFPPAGARLLRPEHAPPVWEPAPGRPFPLVLRASSRSEDRAEILRDFVVGDFPLTGVPPVRQLLCGVGDPPAWTLLTQAHCFLSDLPGIFLLVRLQLQAVTASQAAIQSQRGGPDLRRPRRQRAGRGEEESVQLRTSGGQASSRRMWGTLSFPRDLHDPSSPLVGFAWNDALVGAALEALARWNRAAEAPDQPLAMEVRESIRERPLEGFGNGTASRLARLPPREGLGTTIRSVCRAVALEAAGGEYLDVRRPRPRRSGFGAAAARWRGWRAAPAFAAVAPITLLSPWPRWGGEPLPGRVRGLELVSSLSPGYPIGFAAMPLGERMLVTLTWDPAQLSRKDARTIAADFGGLVERTATTGGVTRAYTQDALPRPHLPA